MFLTVVYSHGSRLQVICRRDIASKIAEVKICWLSEESTPVLLWQVSLSKKSVVYPKPELESEGPGTMTEEKLLGFAKQALSKITQADHDSLDADSFLTDALRESKRFGNGELNAVLKRSPHQVKLSVFNGATRVARLELSFDEFTSAMPRAEMSDRWCVEFDQSDR